MSVFFDWYQQVNLIIVDDDSCYQVTVPGSNEQQGMDFLESVGAGILGAGFRLSQLGSSIPRIRIEYESRLESLIKQVEIKKSVMETPDLARWVSDERTKIARTMRMKQGPMAMAVLEIRDWSVYGGGGRTWKNIYARTAKKTGEPYSRILRGRQRLMPKYQKRQYVVLAC